MHSLRPLKASSSVSLSEFQERVTKGTDCKHHFKLDPKDVFFSANWLIESAYLDKR